MKGEEQRSRHFWTAVEMKDSSICTWKKSTQTYFSIRIEQAAFITHNSALKWI